MVTRTEQGVWMADESRCESLARRIATLALMHLKMDHTDFRLRDGLLLALSPTIKQAMDSAASTNDVYKQAMDSMAAQMIHPKMTGLEMAEMQLKPAK